MNGKGLGAFRPSCTTAGVADLGLECCRGRQPAGRRATKPACATTCNGCALHGSLPRQAGARQDHHEPGPVPAPDRRRRLGYHAGERAPGAGRAQPRHPPRADGQPAGGPRQHGHHRPHPAPGSGLHLFLHHRFAGQCRPPGRLLRRTGPDAARADRAGPPGNRGVRDDAQFQRWPTRSPAGPRWPWPASKSTRRAAGRTGHPRLPAPRHQRARPGRSGPPARDLPAPARPGSTWWPRNSRTWISARLGLVRRGGRGILELDIGAPLDVVLRPGYLSHDVGVYRSAPSASTHNPWPARWIRACSPRCGLGLRAIAARAGPRHHRAGQARRRFDAGLPTPPRYRPGQAAPAPPRRTGS